MRLTCLLDRDIDDILNLPIQHLLHPLLAKFIIVLATLQDKDIFKDIFHSC